jgi:multifunctional cyclase/dehydratase/O-methyltransferase
VHVTSSLAAAVSTPYQRLAELAIGARISMALRVAAQSRIADLLAGGPMSADALSAETGIPAGTLGRLMRGLAQLGVFKELADATFANSDVSAHMVSGDALSLRDMILMLNDDAYLRAWQRLPSVLESGETSFRTANGVTLFDYLANDRQRSETFSRMMSNVYGPEAHKIATGYPFGRFSKVVDVGGGPGYLLAEILKIHPRSKGALLDLAPTAELARDNLQRQGLSDRCQVLSGDFFAEVPAGFNACLIKSVLHDWDDEKAVQILRNCRDALSTDGRVLVIEALVTPGKPLGNPHALVDLEMMVVIGGKERTQGEYSALMHRAGLALTRVTQVPRSYFYVLEAEPV